MEFPAYHIIPEPKLTFEALSNAHDIHPLRGLKTFKPYSSKLNPIGKIRIAAIYPEGSYHIISNLITELRSTHLPKERTAYLESFTGIEDIFGVKVELVPEATSISLSTQDVFKEGVAPYISLSESISGCIREMSKRKLEYDVLMIYLPDFWSPGFEDLEKGFDLHDFIKATSAMLNIASQVIREGSAIKYKCRCSVMWRLSIALYVKTGGIPWKLSNIDQNSAFIGLSYATRLNPNTNQYDYTTCCSQVFDADGTGLEFVAYDAAEIETRVGENPYLTRAEMRKLMSRSLELYQRKHAGRRPERLIVHKTSHFTQSEIDGAFDAIPGNINLELLQIVQNTNFRGIHYLDKNGEKGADGYPLNRGTYFQIGPQEVLLWTQGNVDLNNKKYFKEGKNIPSPILIRRFAGDGGWDRNCQAILGLTKMNWNHDALYDRLPVTLGYAQSLATTIKRMNKLINKPYEFRYFM
ncbi:argonaute/piwi family protein [Pedobacter suwonensis]|uniref:argonaute/piwi family protein n=1 Tax=Pedobacter suwonensis TaxID=332999 RepID=UPI0036C84C94